ncbi:MAG: phosphodiesterase [Kiritimatiellae bacterium]|nr:phosphodiesterase [Kiritimatiellia bacterium]
MKIAFLSDIHGVPDVLEAALGRDGVKYAERIVLLGDLLYHGPRNGVPDMYDPVRVAKLLNAEKDRILAVRGNCDTEVDQMMLEFPILAPYSVLAADGKTFFLTHGHVWNEDNLPPLASGSVLCHGHTHIPLLRETSFGVTIFNPGSLALQKGGSARSYGIWDGERLAHETLQ